jgi:hypothetical protein
MAMPVVLLLAPSVILFGILLGTWWMLLTALAALIIPPVVRGVVIARRINAVGVLAFVRAILVGFAYEYARASALVVRKSHRRAIGRPAATRLGVQQ